jgi:hypothetical protein
VECSVAFRLECTIEFSVKCDVESSVQRSVERNVECSVEKSRVYLCYRLPEDGTWVPKHVGVFCVTYTMSLGAFVEKHLDCRAT